MLVDSNFSAKGPLEVRMELIFWRAAFLGSSEWVSDRRRYSLFATPSALPCHDGNRRIAPRETTCRHKRIDH